MNPPIPASRRRGLVLRCAVALALAVAAASAVVAPLPAQAGVDIGISVNIAPPALPVYEQPMIPGAGYLWTPGYWSWEQGYGYYWVPGTWVRPPYYGALWTPGYWGWRDGLYVFYRGYWGRRVGYYGGINYGHGYNGMGYEGGYWRSNRFYYNRAANNVNIRITNVYNRTIINNVTINRYSYNGPGGARVRPTAAQVAYQNERHTPPVADQVRQRTAARADRSLQASFNKGQPPIGATERAGVIQRPGGMADRARAARSGNPTALSGADAPNRAAIGRKGSNAAAVDASARTASRNTMPPPRVARPGRDGVPTSVNLHRNRRSDAGMQGEAQASPRVRPLPAMRTRPVREPGQQMAPAPRVRSHGEGMAPQGRMQPRQERPAPRMQLRERAQNPRPAPERRPHERGGRNEHGGG